MKKGKPSRFDVVGQLGVLRRYARSLTRDQANAEDLVQDALLKAYERRKTFKPDGDMRGWLLSIVHNTFIDGIRSKRSEERRNEQVAYLAQQSLAAPQENAVRLAQVRSAFLHLPEDQRAALHLVSIEGLSYQEAADTLGIPLGTLMSRIGRARATLRSMEERTGETRASAASHLKLVGGKDD
ncbi:sigma-70 family RNA polymerase sigma factor [Limoniibacter endophyticus]|nr:sigma-70 family RNA polymerase sigma factor [Limoniibacter endophyticus]